MPAVPEPHPQPENRIAPCIYEHRRHKWQFGIAVAAALIAGTLVGLHFVHRPAVKPGISQRRLTANRSEAPVLSATLSPSGKYLAFADTTGVYLRQVDSGETHPIPLPTGFVGTPVSWFSDDNICSYLPTLALARPRVYGEPQSWVASRTAMPKSHRPR